MPNKGIENFLMPIGFYSLGIEIVGLIVLWTGFRKRERAAWFAMLILLLFFIFPPYVLTLLVKSYEWKLGVADCSQLLQSALDGDWQSIGIVLGVLTFIVMLTALLLPIKGFFWESANPSAENRYRKEDASSSTGTG
jgi:hypothetical protein